MGMTDMEMTGLRRFREEVCRVRKLRAEQLEDKLCQIRSRANELIDNLHRKVTVEGFGILSYGADIAQLAGKLEECDRLLQCFDDFAHDYFPEVNNV